jgi:hypothetical protein
MTLADELEDPGIPSACRIGPFTRASTSVICSSWSEALSRVRASTPVASMWLSASASNTSQRTGPGAPSIASWTRPRT